MVPPLLKAAGAAAQARSSFWPAGNSDSILTSAPLVITSSTSGFNPLFLHRSGCHGMLTHARVRFYAGRGLSQDFLFETAGPLTATELVHRLAGMTGTVLSPGRSNVDRWSLTSCEQQAALDAQVHSSLGSSYRLQPLSYNERRPPSAHHAPLNLDELRVLQTELQKLDASMHRISGVGVKRSGQ